MTCYDLHIYMQTTRMCTHCIELVKIYSPVMSLLHPHPLPEKGFLMVSASCHLLVVPLTAAKADMPR